MLLQDQKCTPPPADQIFQATLSEYTIKYCESSFINNIVLVVRIEIHNIIIIIII